MKCGSPIQERAKMYPEDSIQFAFFDEGEWWRKDEKHIPRRGSLIWAIVPYVDQLPYAFEPIGRREADRHNDAEFRIAPINAKQSFGQTDLPVAAFPIREGEIWAAYRSKRRPCLVLGCPGEQIAKDLIRGKPKHGTAPTLLVAPYYGADRSSRRAGYRPEFLERIRHLLYPQFFLDSLPIGGVSESVLRLDHLQPIGAHYKSFDMTEYCLSQDALAVMDELLQWHIYRKGPEDEGFVAMFKHEIESALE